MKLKYKPGDLIKVKRQNKPAILEIIAVRGSEDQSYFEYLVSYDINYNGAKLSLNERLGEGLYIYPDKNIGRGYIGMNERYIIEEYANPKYSDPDGMTCCGCGNFSPMATSNWGTNFACWSCRSTRAWQLPKP